MFAYTVVAVHYKISKVSSSQRLVTFKRESLQAAHQLRKLFLHKDFILQIYKYLHLFSTFDFPVSRNFTERL